LGVGNMRAVLNIGLCGRSPRGSGEAH